MPREIPRSFAVLILGIAAIILSAVFASCVWVTDSSTYNRTETVTQAGSNRLNKADIGVRP